MARFGSKLHQKLFPGASAGVNPLAYPWITPPPGFLYIDRNRSTSVPAGSTNLVLETIQLTQGYEGWIVLCGLFASTFNNFFFTHLQGGAPMRDYVRITAPLGQPDNPQPIFIKIVQNQPFVVTATNTGGGLVAVRYRYFGWYYPGSRGGAALDLAIRER